MNSNSNFLSFLSLVDKVCEVYETKNNENNSPNIRMIRNILSLRNINQDINNNKNIMSNIFNGNQLITEVASQFITNCVNNVNINDNNNNDNINDINDINDKKDIKKCLFSELDEKTLNINDNCSICFESMSEKIVSITICNHVYHDNCLDEWLLNNKTCPLCRYELKIC